MKNITYLFSALILLFGIAIQSVHAQRFGDGERGERIKALWVAYITQELNLNSDESAKFWPIYNEFIDKEQHLNQERRKLHKKSPQEMSDAEIDVLFNKTMQMEEESIALKRVYYEKLKTAIPTRKIMMLPHAEREFKKKIVQLIQERRNHQGPGNNPGGRFR